MKNLNKGKWKIVKWYRGDEMDIIEKLKIYTNDEFGEVKIITKNNKVYIEATQVARILGYVNPRDAIIRHCSDEGVMYYDVGVVTGIRSDGNKSIQYVSKKFIDEGNLYRLIVKSKLPTAKRFESWIMDEVLPSIRKNGTYISDNLIDDILNNPDLIIQMATRIKNEKMKRILEKQRADKLESDLKKDILHTNFAKKIQASKDSITIGQFAKLLNNSNLPVGRNRLYSWLRENGYLIKSGKDKNIPKQVYIEQGLFSVSERIINTKDKDILSTIPLITGKGQLYFEKLIISEYEGEYTGGM